MTKEEEIALRELAAGRCTIQKVVDAIGPLSLWSKDGLDREIRKAVEAEREACIKEVIQRKMKLKHAYRKEANISTYSKLQEVTLILSKIQRHDARTSVKDTGSAERGDTPELQHYQPSVSPDGRYI